MQPPLLIGFAVLIWFTSKWVCEWQRARKDRALAFARAAELSELIPGLALRAGCASAALILVILAAKGSGVS